LRRKVVVQGLLIQIRTPTSKLHASATRHKHESNDPRLKDLDLVGNEFAALRETYSAPKYPIILAHGLLGFEELHLTPAPLRPLNIPGLHYWRGITEALAERKVEIITATVSPSGSVEARAAKLAETISEKAKGRAVNIIA
jgi:triacylglycerol lipase